MFIMVECGQEKNSFDELVAGISSEERKVLLERVKNCGTDASVQTMEMSADDIPDNRTIQIRVRSESLLYRFILWLRSFFTKIPKEEIYNSDLIEDLAHKVNRVHPGLVDFFNPFFMKNYVN